MADSTYTLYTLEANGVGLETSHHPRRDTEIVEAREQGILAAVSVAHHDDMPEDSEGIFWEIYSKQKEYLNVLMDLILKDRV